VWFNPFDIFIYWDPRYSRHERERVDAGGSMSFLEAIFSFVFGDGDPNMSFEERRWRALGEHIQVWGDGGEARVLRQVAVVEGAEGFSRFGVRSRGS
jgi:hypothetical protein